MDANAITILKMGDPRLAERSEDVVDFSTQALQNIISDMQEAMNAHQGVGIAAPQIGVQQRIIIFGFERNPRYPNESPVPLTTLINPTYEPLSDEKVPGWEGCLSVPGLRGLVPRYQKIKYRGYSEEGVLIERIVTGFHARIIQHECDHIDGVLFPQRIKDLRLFGFEDVLQERLKGC